MSEMTIESPAVARINEKHELFLTVGKKLAEQVIQQINTAREIGLLLMSERERCRYGEWQSMFSGKRGKSVTDYAFRFSVETARNYMRVARYLKDPITSLPEGVRLFSDMLRMAGQLPEPEASEPRNASGDFFSTASKRISGVIGLVEKWKEGRPIESWPEERRESLRETLKPLVEVYEMLGGELAQG